MSLYIYIPWEKNIIVKGAHRQYNKRAHRSVQTVFPRPEESRNRHSFYVRLLFFSTHTTQQSMKKRRRKEDFSFVCFCLALYLLLGSWMTVLYSRKIITSIRGKLPSRSINLEVVVAVYLFDVGNWRQFITGKIGQSFAHFQWKVAWEIIWYIQSFWYVNG